MTGRDRPSLESRDHDGIHMQRDYTHTYARVRAHTHTRFMVLLLI